MILELMTWFVMFGLFIIKKLVGSGDLVVGQNFKTKDDLVNVIKQ
jgi:hypothetical protein